MALKSGSTFALGLDLNGHYNRLTLIRIRGYYKRSLRYPAYNE